MANLTNIYSDLDLTFNRQPSTGDISIVKDSRAVINSVKNLLLTNYYDRLWQPNVGSNLTALLFENVTPLMESVISNEITIALKNYEPRVTIDVLSVSASTQEDGYNVFLSFFIGNSTQPTNVSVFLERIR